MVEKKHKHPYVIVRCSLYSIIEQKVTYCAELLELVTSSLFSFVMGIGGGKTSGSGEGGISSLEMLFVVVLENDDIEWWELAL